MHIAKICNNMTEPDFDLIRLIRRHGLRLTPQRRLILDVIRQAGGHLTIDQIYAPAFTNRTRA